MSPILFILLVILTVVATVAVMGWIFYKIIKSYFKNQQKTLLLQMKLDQHAEALKVVTPIRLQAYERMVLFLERISPDSLILRCYTPGMDLRLLQGVMTKNIRDEWEHNLSQQVYLSSESWTRIREAKEEMINLINSSAVQLPATAETSTLAATIFATAAKQAPTDAALEFLKKEIRENFSD